MGKKNLSHAENIILYIKNSKESSGYVWDLQFNTIAECKIKIWKLIMFPYNMN